MEIVNFTPVSALIGGALIGLSAAFLLWSQGRIAGISGIVGGLTKPVRGDIAWRVVFVIGLVLGGTSSQWSAPGFWSWPVCWSALAPLSALVAPAATASVAWRDAVRVHWSRRRVLWAVVW